MPIQLVTELTAADTALMREAVDGFVPERVFDAHAHLFHTRHFAPGNRPAFLPEDTAFGIEAYHEALSRWLARPAGRGAALPVSEQGQ